MDDSGQHSLSNRSPLVRFVRWLGTWRGVRSALVVSAWIATIIALLYAEENWRGRRAWSRYRQSLEARGERFDLKEFIPKPVPDEQNFAATPFIKSWFSRHQASNAGDNPFITEQAYNARAWSRSDNYGRASDKVPSGAWKTDRQFIDLVAWQMAFESIRSGHTNPGQKFQSDRLDAESRARAAPAVLAGLKTNEAIFAELRAASQRPYSRYPVIYDLDNPWGILIPHLANLKAVCQRLQLKACAELAAGQSDTAWADVKLLLYLADSVKDEPLLMSYLVHVACFQIAVQPIWEGLAEHRWTEAQLQELQSRLQTYDFLSRLQQPLHGERAAGVLTADLLYRKKYRLSHLIDSPDWAGEGFVDVLARFIPRGWYYQEQLTYCRLYQQLDGALDRASKRMWPERIESNVRQMDRALAGGKFGKAFDLMTRHNVLAGLLLPALGKLSLKTASAQAVADQAALACALERFRLANGQFPETLDALAPRFVSQLPHDALTGEPYKYRRTDHERFVLYSVGWNEKDDNGLPGKKAFDDKEGDWIWRYPAKQSP